MDAKLGTVLYEPSANAEKRAKMEHQARITTTAETGLRLTGCQVSIHTSPFPAFPSSLSPLQCTIRDRTDTRNQTWHDPSQSYMLTPKSFGKTISVDKMPQGMVRFFPAPADGIPSLVIPPTPPPSASIPPSDPSIKTPLPLPASDQNTITATIVTPLNGEYTHFPIPPTTMIRVLALIDKELADLETVLNTLEMRFVGSSVLIVYEGDLARLEEALTQWEGRLKQRDPLVPEPEVDSDEEEDGDEDEEESDSDMDLDGKKEDEKLARECPPIKVKMIDFAHTWITEGEGVDQGVLKGLGTLRELVQKRKMELGNLTLS